MWGRENEWAGMKEVSKVPTYLLAKRKNASRREGGLGGIKGNKTYRQAQGTNI